MEATKKRTGLYWLGTIVSVIAFFAMLKFNIGGEYCSMVLPFTCTWFAKALDIM